MDGTLLLYTLIGTLGAMILGALWYSPFLFGALWKQLLTRYHGKLRGLMTYPMPVLCMGQGIAEALHTVVFGLLVILLGLTTPGEIFGLAGMLLCAFTVTHGIEGLLWKAENGQMMAIWLGHRVMVMLYLSVLATLMLPVFPV